MVVLYHSGLFLSGGFVGVDVFFVISGFVITASLQREWVASGTVRLRHFYARRVRRLLPALSLATTVTVIASALLQSPNGPQQETAKTAFGTIATVANFVIPRSIGNYFSAGAEQNPLLHTWSLSVEEQFFLVFPAVLVAGWALGRSQRAMNWSPAAWMVVGGLAVPSILMSVATSYEIINFSVLGGSSRLFAFYSSATRAWEFAVGALLVLMSERLACLPDRLLIRLGIVGSALVVGSALFISDGQTFPGIAVVAPVLGTAAIIVSRSSERPGGTSYLEHPLLVWIGDLSYSWYLWHWPAVVFTRLHLSERWWVVSAAAVLSLLPAYLSYRYVEVPIRRSTRFIGRGMLGVALAAVLIPGMATTVLAVGSRSGWGLDWPVGAHVVVQSGCDHGRFDPDGCTWNVDDPRGVVLLAGDSQSWAVADGLIAAAGQLGYSTTVASLNGCSFVLPAGAEELNDKAVACGVFRRAVLDHATLTGPAIVVISNWSVGYVRDTPDSRDLWETGLAGGLGPLEAIGVPVIIVSSYPAGDEHSINRSLLVGPRADRSTDAARQRAERDWLVDLESEIADSYGSVYLFDPYEVFCDREFCRTAEDGNEYYTDTNHLSRAGSLLLVPSLEELLASTLG